MGFKIAYTFLAKNQFSQAANKIDQDAKRIHKRMTKISEVVHKANKHWGDLASSMKEAGAKASLFLTLPIAFGFKKMIDMASDAEETANKFGEVFKGIGKEGEASVGRLKNEFKLASSTSKELLSNTGDLLVGLGLNREKALELSESVVRLSADVASFKNVEGGAARAAMSLTKALLGEREMLKETFKTAVNEEEVKERAIKIAQKMRGLTERQAKALATLELVTERNKDAIGDFARTQDAYANLTRTNQELTKEMAESFGKLLLPIAIKVRKVFIAITEKLNNMSPAAKTIILIILAIIAVIGPLMIIIGSLISAFVGLSAMAAIAGVSIGALLLPILAIVAVVGLVITAIVMLANRWDDVVGGAKLLWQDFVDFIISGAIAIANGIKDFIIAPAKLAGKIAGFLGADSIANAIEEIDRRLTIGGEINNMSKSQTDVNISVQGQPGTIQNAASKTTGAKNANIGFNVIEAQW